MLTPEEIEALSSPIADVYRNCVDELLTNIAAHLRGGGDLSALEWETLKLGAFGQLRRENIDIIKTMTGNIPELLNGTLGNAIMSALDRIEPELAAAAAAGVLAGIDLEPEASEQIYNILRNYSAQAADQLNLVNTVMLNSSLMQFRRAVSNTAVYEAQLDRAQEILNTTTGLTAAGISTRTQAVCKAVREMNTAGLTGFKDAAGKNWSVEAYVNMDIRTTVHNVAIQSVMTRNEQYGNNLISTSAHAGARPLCFPYQAMVFSTDGTSGTVEDLNGSAIDFTPLQDTSYGEAAGLFGINCGHFMYPFIPGMSVVHDEVIQSKEENDRQYKENQKQRKLERSVREAKREAAMMNAAGDKEGFEKAAQKVQLRQANLNKFLENTGRTARVDRTQVEGYNRSVAAKVAAANKAAAEKALQQAAQSDSARSMPTFISRLFGKNGSGNQGQNVPSISVADFVDKATKLDSALAAHIPGTPISADLQTQLVELNRLRSETLSKISNQKWMQSLTDADRNEFLDFFDRHMNTNELGFWERNGSLIKGDFYSAKYAAHGGGAYGLTSKLVTMNIKHIDDINLFLGYNKVNFTTFFHETGHAFNNLLGRSTAISDQIPNFADLIRSDVLNTSNMILAKRAIFLGKIRGVSDWIPRTNFAQYTNDDISAINNYLRGYYKGKTDDAEKVAIVSDLFSGASSDLFSGSYGHRVGYFSDDTVLTDEAWAEFSECLFCGGYWELIIQKHFPQSYDAFCRKYEELTKTL